MCPSGVHNFERTSIQLLQNIALNIKYKSIPCVEPLNHVLVESNTYFMSVLDQIYIFYPETRQFMQNIVHAFFKITVTIAYFSGANSF